MMKQSKHPSAWDDTPISDQLLVCPLCERTFLEMGPAKTHFATKHNAKFDETHLSEDVWKRSSKDNSVQ